jgi:hypothetical protein
MSREAFIIVASVLAFGWAPVLSAKAEMGAAGSDKAPALASQEVAGAFVGHDLHLVGGKVTSQASGAGQQVLVFEGRFSTSIGSERVAGDSAVVWLERTAAATGARGGGLVTKVRIYVEGGVSIHKGGGAKLTEMSRESIKRGEAEVIRFDVSGEVFVTSDSRGQEQIRASGFYARAFSAAAKNDADFAARFVGLSPVSAAEDEKQKTPLCPSSHKATKGYAGQAEDGGQKTENGKQRTKDADKKADGSFFDRWFRRGGRAPAEGARETAKKVQYPVNIAPAGDVTPKIETGKLDGNDVGTIIGRFYLWQKLDETGGLLELQADNAVVFYSDEQSAGDLNAPALALPAPAPAAVLPASASLDASRGGRRQQDAGASRGGGQEAAGEGILAKGTIKAVYVCGDVVLTEGQRTIRADELYYDFENRKGLAVNAVMRTFDVQRGIPIYLRAAMLKQLGDGKFTAENITLTSSEFYLPQVSLGASSVIITDTTTVDAQTGKVSKSSYEAVMRDVRLKHGETTIFGWPVMRSNLERPDVPVKSIRLGHDNIWGTSAETRWYLSRLLGLREPEGTDGTFELDYYGNRGLGTGVEVEYTGEDHLGRMTGYIINDRGEDRLGRVASRRNLQPPEELRGRFSWVHRAFMPYNWQVTTGINYESDENFVESYYRNEFNVGEDRETYIHARRAEDNWALAFLGKGRINSFRDELEEMPSAEFHLTGQSLFDDRFTFYSDSQAGQFRQRIGDGHSTVISDEQFGFASHRSEIDMPMAGGGFKAVPYLAGTVGYDDRSEFTRTLVDGTNTGSPNEDVVGIGEVGLRASSEFWKVYPGVRSRLWDLDGLRHIVRPELAAAVYGESDIVVRQHDVLHVGLSQQLQTKRGPADNQRAVDWMRLDTAFTFVGDSEDEPTGGPDRFMWNRPMTPLRMFTMPGMFNGDLGAGLRRFELWGPRRNYFSADYAWRASDTTALLSDLYYDMQGGDIEQFDIGFSRACWPDLSYYIGSRYLRRVEVLGEKGSNAFVFAATYVLDPRYTLVFSQQFDFDYGANIESDVTLIRRYHRLFWALTYSTDGSLARQSIVFSIWPEGVPEMAIGSRRYTGLTGPGGY